MIIDLFLYLIFKKLTHLINIINLKFQFLSFIKSIKIFIKLIFYFNIITV
jgi:hypothetical protein